VPGGHWTFQKAKKVDKEKRKMLASGWSFPMICQTYVVTDWSITTICPLVNRNPIFENSDRFELSTLP